MSMLVISFDSGAMACSIWSSPGEARIGCFSDLEIANEYGSGSGPVFVFSQTDVGGDSDQRAAVGIRADSEFESPVILGREWGGAYWIGCNSSLYRIWPSMVIDREISLESHFGNLRLISELGKLIVLTEVGVFAVRKNGDVDWRVDLDIITDVRWESGSVVISQMDGPQVRVDLRSGRAVSHI
ncbi:hypothetical protein [Actinomadura monticuli]|uniref:Uncharacterized protein n=1 Tax=Actinomadura monticuli TaxID=3097367 RepID=A0ABV4QHS6_9ACTN